MTSNTPSQNSTSNCAKDFIEYAEPIAQGTIAHCDVDNQGSGKMSNNDQEQTLVKLLSNVIKEMEKHRKFDFLVKLLRLVNSWKLPMENIAFLLDRE